MDIVIVEGHRLKGMLDGLYPRDRIRVLYNGINPVDVRKGLPVHRDGKPFNILFMGNVSFAKGFYDLILAYKKILEKHPEVQLNFTGEIIRLDNERNIIPEYFSGKIKERFLNSTDEIIKFVNKARSYNANHLGFIEEEAKRRVLEDADIFVLPSYSEGFSCAVLEALAFGLPIVTTNVGALPEIVTDGENGFVIEPGDYEALSEKIIQLIEDQKLRREMALRNVEKAEREFNIERVAKELGDIFVGVLSVRKDSTE
jgi:glycosyltransferase involved in cell wall biosynthesis